MKVHAKIRPLTEKEFRFLRNQKAALRRRRSTLWQRSLTGYFLIFGILALLTLWAERKNPQFVLGFWTILGAAISIPSFFQEWQRLSRRIADFEYALTAGICEDLTITARRMWEFEEEEDEGACYAFQLETGGVVFVAGQDFYSSARFPNTDFSVVEIRDRKKKVLEMIVEKRGKKMPPERLVSVKEKKAIELPSHGAFFECSLEEMVDQIRKPAVANSKVA